MKRSRLLGAVLLAASALLCVLLPSDTVSAALTAGTPMSSDSEPLVQTEAEIVSYDPDTGAAMAVGMRHGGLFTFSTAGAYLVDAEGRQIEPETISVGTLVTLTGPNRMLATYPEQYPDVSQVQVTGSRPDFMALHYDELYWHHASLFRDVLDVAVDGLGDLTAGEKEALRYRLMCDFGVY